MALVKEYTDIEFLSDLSELVSENPTVSQRDISGRVGVSTAIINGLIKRCIARGWIATKNLTLRKLQYMVTPKGFEALSKRSISFMKRNFAELNRYKTNIDSHVQKAKETGKTRVVLYGKSDISFLIENSCRELGMEFVVKEENPNSMKIEENEFIIMGEALENKDNESMNKNQIQSVFALAR